MIRGAVQGIGFRPFVYRVAKQLGLMGWVSNSPQGVSIEVEGGKEEIDALLLRIEREKPPRSFIQGLEFSILDPVGLPAFEIRASEQAGTATALVLPDIATCSDCLREIFDTANRRYLYPFTNCTHCGPRFTIIQSLPYDRANTTMKVFNMCAACQEEYEDPLDRRFHAQPNACPECGPRLELWDKQRNRLAGGHAALLQAADSLRDGKILAVKGLGGFHLLVDARNENVVLRLRALKHREEKPFALMYPNLASVQRDCELSELEQRLLMSPECPIVLLRRRPGSDDRPNQISSAIAPHNPNLGVMLPYTPLHHLLMKQLSFPLVATSGNRRDEPICITEEEALQRLNTLVDGFLVHNRPIFRHLDDSIVRVILGRELVLRRARGYAPLPIGLEGPIDSILAVGAHLKNAVAMAVSTESFCSPSAQEGSKGASLEACDGLGRTTLSLKDPAEDCLSIPASQVFISQHIGDLATQEAYRAFQRVISDFRHLYHTQPQLVVRDLHPDYLSSQYANEYALCQGIPLISVQHHYAHVAACMAENQLEAPVLGVCWDGSGYGSDGTIWGGEFLLADETSFRRVGHFRHFKLPGGEAAIREPKRTALGVLYGVLGDGLFEEQGLLPVRQFAQDELSVLRQMLRRGINSPNTSSVGRFFDAVASISGLRHEVNFEGQAAMALEWAVDAMIAEGFEFELREGEMLIVDWEPTILQVVADVQRRVSIERIATKFHNTLVEVIMKMARRIEEEKVVLSGGCFQNRYLLERSVQRLEAEGFRPYWHQRVPPNDGGIALGQVFAAMRRHTHRSASLLRQKHVNTSSVSSPLLV
jgi:hydrogenase maturation protein HypF